MGMNKKAEVERQYDQALELLYKGDYTNAIASFTRVIGLDPNDAVAYDRRGCAYQELANYEQALTDHNKAIELNPALSSAYDNRGRLHASRGNIDTAIADHTKALEVDPSNITAYNNRAVAYGDKGEWAKSISDLDCAIRIDHKYTEGYQLRGFAKFQIGRHSEAITDFTRAIELDKRQSYPPLAQRPMAERNVQGLPTDFGALLLSQLPGYGYLRVPGDVTPMCLFWRSKAHRSIGNRLPARKDEKEFERLTRTQMRRPLREKLLDWFSEHTSNR